MKYTKVNIKNTAIKGYGIIKLALLNILIIGTFSNCNDFLDVVPDDIPNKNHAYANKKEAERVVATLYTKAPDVTVNNNIMFLGADDSWTYYNSESAYYPSNYAWRIALGEQNSNNPYANAWDGANSMKNMFQGIRECNDFLEEIAIPNRVLNLDDQTKKKWIAEAKFLKAYYHFILFRMYGPIPITDVNIPLDVPADELKVKRDPVDDVVDYLSNLLDEAAVDLPLVVDNPASETGRATKGMALALKARLLVTAASPLFNGNPDYKGFKDKDGVLLFSQEEDPAKWQKAADACKEALDNLPDASLYEFTRDMNNSEVTLQKMSYRGAVTERIDNPEVIWPRYNGGNFGLQTITLPANPDPSQPFSYYGSYLSPTLSYVERFYTKNGVPLNEDKEWNNKWGYDQRYNVAKADAEQAYNVQNQYETAILHMDRENRFYASILFDGSYLCLKNYSKGTELYKTLIPIQAKLGQSHQFISRIHHTVTGYYVGKLTPWEWAITTAGGAVISNYPWPEMRLADLYLLYAEALNEIGNRDEAIKYIDLVRARSGLEGVKESWTKYSNNPTKYTHEEGLREIIHQEREVELAFEGQYIWDTRRWKIAGERQNINIRGWNSFGKATGEYYQIKVLHDMRFVTPRDYLWPISVAELRRNPNLVQNPGW